MVKMTEKLSSEATKDQDSRDCRFILLLNSTHWERQGRCCSAHHPQW